MWTVNVNAHTRLVEAKHKGSRSQDQHYCINSTTKIKHSGGKDLWPRYAYWNILDWRKTAKQMIQEWTPTCYIPVSTPLAHLAVTSCCHGTRIETYSIGSWTQWHRFQIVQRTTLFNNDEAGNRPCCVSRLPLPISSVQLIRGDAKKPTELRYSFCRYGIFNPEKCKGDLNPTRGSCQVKSLLQ